MRRYPGEYDLPESADPGFPAWVQWQHFFNVFLIVLIIRSGLQVRTEKRPGAYWTPKWSKNGNGKISLKLWFHQSLDILWLVNGVVFVVLLFVTGHWMRIVPTSWEVFPNALSALLQYVSLDWPTENGWVNYNSLQQLMYFITVFIAAPLAAITGVRMSGLWPKNAKTLNRVYPVEWARAIHFPVMLYFVAFIIVHVALVFATGALRNLNHMYGGTDVVNWAGFWIFFVSLRHHHRRLDRRQAVGARPDREAHRQGHRTLITMDVTPWPEIVREQVLNTCSVIAIVLRPSRLSLPRSRCPGQLRHVIRLSPGERPGGFIAGQARHTACDPRMRASRLGKWLWGSLGVTPRRCGESTWRGAFDRGFRRTLAWS